MKSTSQLGALAVLVVALGLPRSNGQDAAPSPLGEPLEVLLDRVGVRRQLTFTAPADGVLTVCVLETPPEHAPFTWWVRADGTVVREGERDVPVREGERLVLGLRSQRFTWEERASRALVRLRVDFLPESAPGEPDDTPAQAREVQLGEEVSLAFLHRGDRDHLALTAPTDGVLTVRLLETPPEHAPFTWWVRADGTVVREGERDVPVRAGERLVLGLRSQRFTWEERASRALVRLRVDFLPESAPGEPDDTPAQAREVQLGEEVSLAFLHRGDRDHLALTAPADGVLAVRVLETPPEHAPFTWWVRADGTVVREGERDAPVRAGERLVLGLRSQRFTWEERASRALVRLRVDFLPESAPGEPDDTPAQAREVQLGEEVSLAFLHRGDRDHLALTAPADGVLAVRVLETPPEHAPFTWWVRADGTVVREGERDALVRAGERLVLGVRSQRFTWQERASQALVRLRVDLVRPLDAFEPNDDPGAATPLRVGRRVRAELAGPDVDFYAVDAPGGTWLEARVDATGLDLAWLGATRVEGRRAWSAEPRTVLLRVAGLAGAEAATATGEGARVPYSLVAVELGRAGGPAGDYPRDPPPLERIGRPRDLEGTTLR